jgi:hypothetical protein
VTNIRALFGGGGGGGGASHFKIYHLTSAPADKLMSDFSRIER